VVEHHITHHRIACRVTHGYGAGALGLDIHRREIVARTTLLAIEVVTRANYTQKEKYVE
jgi:hypothetical protein